MENLAPSISEIIRQVKDENVHRAESNAFATTQALEKVITLGLIEAQNNPAFLVKDEFGNSPFQKFVVRVGRHLVMGALTEDVVRAYRRGVSEAKRVTA